MELESYLESFKVNHHLRTIPVFQVLESYLESFKGKREVHEIPENES